MASDAFERVREAELEALNITGEAKGEAARLIDEALLESAQTIDQTVSNAREASERRFSEARRESQCLAEDLMFKLDEERESFLLKSKVNRQIAINKILDAIAG